MNDSRNEIDKDIVGVEIMQELPLKYRITLSMLLPIVFLVITYIGSLLGWFPQSGNIWNLIWPVLVFTAGFALSVLFFEFHNSLQIKIAGLMSIMLGVFRILFNIGVIPAQVWKWFWMIPVGIIVLVLVFVQFGHSSNIGDFVDDVVEKIDSRLDSQAS